MMNDEFWVDSSGWLAGRLGYVQHITGGPTQQTGHAACWRTFLSEWTRGCDMGKLLAVRRAHV